MYKTESENKSLIKSEISTYGLHILDLMQNENFDGYFERFSICNGFKDAQSANKFIKDNIKITFPEFRHYTKVWYFSKILNLSMDQILHQHTLTPLSRSLIVKPIAYPSEEESFFVKVKRNALPKSQPYNFLCRQCVEEDINHWGISYWRRDHELPGFEWCLKHNSTLEIAIGKDVYKTPPSYFVENNLTQTFEPSALLYQNRFLQRYVQLVTDFFDLNFLLDHCLTKKVIIEKLVSISSLKFEFHFYKDIYRIMDRELPFEWIKAYFPKILHQGYKSKESYCYRNILSGTFEGKTLINYLLMIAVIFDDTDEALLKLKAVHINTPSAIKTPIHAQPQFI